jgi:hypothetical protein
VYSSLCCANKRAKETSRYQPGTPECEKKEKKKKKTLASARVNHRCATLHPAMSTAGHPSKKNLIFTSAPNLEVLHFVVL